MKYCVFILCLLAAAAHSKTIQYDFERSGLWFMTDEFEFELETVSATLAIDTEAQTITRFDILSNRFTAALESPVSILIEYNGPGWCDNCVTHSVIANGRFISDLGPTAFDMHLSLIIYPDQPPLDWLHYHDGDAIYLSGGKNDHFFLDGSRGPREIPGVSSNVPEPATLALLVLGLSLLARTGMRGSLPARRRQQTT